MNYNDYLILDVILRSIVGSNGIPMKVLMEIVANDKDVYEHEMKERFFPAINKLVKDGYIDVVPNEFETGEINNEQVHMTFEGELLISSGGYVEMVKRETSQRESNRFYEKIVRGGAIIGGLYALFEIWRGALDLWFRYDFWFSK